MSTHRNPFRNPETIDNTRDEIAAVLAENIRKHDHSTEKLGIKTVQSAVQQELEEYGSPENLRNQLERLLPENYEQQTAFIDAFQDTQALFKRVYLDVPTPMNFDWEGVDFESISRVWDRMEKDAMTPEIIITPHLSAEQWFDIYENLAHDRSINSNPLATRQQLGSAADNELRPGLLITNEVQENWREFDYVAQTSTPTVETEDSEHFPIAWTIRIVEGGSRAQAMDKPYSPRSDDYLSLSEYLTLQARRVQEGYGDVVDQEDSTWLSGNLFNNQGLAGCFFEDAVMIRFNLAVKDVHEDEQVNDHRKAWG